jgi:glycosyltransferase involved in cell wall biosynthesis
LRREWGAGDATLVVALIGQPVEWTDAMRGAIALGRAVKAGRRAMLVVHSRARSRAIAQNWARRLGLSRHLVIDDRVERPWRIASGLDACVATMSVGGAGEAGPWMPGDLPLAAAMAEGLPVMADPATWVPGLVEGGGAAGAAGPQPVDPLALQLMALCDVPGLRAALGTEAQRRARQARDPEAYRDRMDAIYGRCG